MSVNSISRRKTVALILVTAVMIGYVGLVITNMYVTEINSLNPEELENIRPGGISVKPFLIVMSIGVLIVFMLPRVPET